MGDDVNNGSGYGWSELRWVSFVYLKLSSLIET
jgi:hypothetical protein